MPSLQEIKNRLGSVATTKKITKAMQLVATAKLQRAKGNLTAVQEYYTSIYEMTQDLLSNIQNVDKLFPENNVDSTMYVVITSDIGLAGGYNSNIIKLLKANYRKQDKVVVIGNKGIATLRYRGIIPAEEYPNAGDEPNYGIAAEAGKFVLASYLAQEVNKICILHTKFINSVTFEATITQLLPMVQKEEPKSNEPKSIIEFEPDAETVLKNGLPLFIRAMIYGAFMESKVSEMSSRRTAMENATDNAEELIEKLELEYNRARQSTITQEISEIIAGAGSE